jgi:hypothetical protein
VGSIRENCLQPLLDAGITFDILVHTYTFKGEYINLRNHESAGRLNISESFLLDPSYLYVENQDEFDEKISFESFATHGDPWDNHFESLKNHIRALNSLHHLAQVVQLSNDNPFFYEMFVKRKSEAISTTETAT